MKLTHPRHHRVLAASLPLSLGIHPTTVQAQTHTTAPTDEIVAGVNLAKCHRQQCQLVQAIADDST